MGPLNHWPGASELAIGPVDINTCCPSGQRNFSTLCWLSKYWASTHLEGPFNPRI